MSQPTPTALARESFDAWKRRDIARYVSLFHPDEIKRFKAFATDVFQDSDPDEPIRAIRAAFAPFNTKEAVAAASGTELITAFLKNMLKSIPGFDEIMASAKLEVLGEVPERRDKVHVITRTLLPRPQPVSCQSQGGRWYQLLNEDVMRTMTAFRQHEHFRKKNVAVEKVLNKMELEDFTVLGHVKDGDDLAQVLCRTRMKVDDFSFPILACYPVRKGEPAWDLLGDKTKLADAMRSKFAR